MTQDEAIIIIQEAIGQVDDTIKRLEQISPGETFGYGMTQLDFSQGLYNLRSARIRLESSLEAAGSSKTD
jgi:hypothetical protein